MNTKKITIKVKFEVTAEDSESAEIFVTRLLRYGFCEISEAEPITYEAISSWDFLDNEEFQ